jgi:hypothetical protein
MVEFCAVDPCVSSNPSTPIPVLNIRLCCGPCGSVDAFVEPSDRARAPGMAFVLEQLEADSQSYQHHTVNLRVY